MALIYLGNAFELRESFLPSSKNNALHVNQWLLDNQVIPHIVLDNIYAEGTQRALYALRFAYEINDKDKSIKRYFDGLIEERSRNTRLAGVTPQLLRSNADVLEEQCRITSYDPLCQMTTNLRAQASRMQDSLDYIALTDSIKVVWEDETVPDSTLLVMHQRIADRYVTFDPFPKTTQAHINDFQRNIAQFDKTVLHTQHDTMAYYDQIDLWKAFADTLTRTSPYTQHAAENIQQLENAANEMIVLYDAESIVTADRVENREPVGPRSQFNTGIVTTWVRLKTKVPGRVTVRWYSNGKVFYTYGYNVPRATSYRMYFQKRYKQENIGDGEIRIYNSDDVLIGRRVFTVDA